MMSAIVWACNWVISNVGAGLVIIIDLLPDSPFLTPATPPAIINLGYITWLIPFPTMIGHLALLLVAIATYYGIRIAARWLKVARG